SFFFFLFLSPPRSSLFPYTTLFRSPLLPDRFAARVRDESDREPSRYAFSTRKPALSSKASLDRGLAEAFCRSDKRDKFSLCHRRSEEHTSELQSRFDLVCRLLLEKK